MVGVVMGVWARDMLGVGFVGVEVGCCWALILGCLEVVRVVVREN
jgi:hypothetical protein